MAVPAPYDDVVLAAPVTVPYVRYSIRSAHWFLGRAVAELLATSKIPKARIDGLAVASFTLAPDTAVGLTQHLEMTVRWLDHVPMGGASGIVSIRRAARAVQNGDAEIVACIAGDTNHTGSLRASLFSPPITCEHMERHARISASCAWHSVPTR
jgi:acetyl-CoA acetyltransferase